MGVLDFFKKKNTLVDNLADQWRKETEQFKAENKTWEKEFSSLIGNRAKAHNLEKAGRLNEAITEYETCVEKGISSPQFTIYNYAHDINRLAILYRKTKQHNKEISFLKRMIDLHKDFSDICKWKDRLERAKKLNEK